MEKCKQLQFGTTIVATTATESVEYDHAKRLLDKIREAIGLDACTGCYTAAAPISHETLWFFAAWNIPVWECFGQSESTGPHTMSSRDQWKVGYCGRPMRGTVTKHDCNTGELIYAGRHVFMGYMYNEKETLAALDSDGFLHSGDIVEWDEHNQENMIVPSGFMKIGSD